MSSSSSTTNGFTVTIVSTTPIAATANKTNETTVTAQRSADCSVCGHKAPNVRKLKTHLLLKHPELNLCLFCVEKKGWSDTFASQRQYNQHYLEMHEGAIAKRKDDAAELVAKRHKRRSSSNNGGNNVSSLPGCSSSNSPESSPKSQQQRQQDFCFLCPDKPGFVSGVDHDRHLISVHGYDYCKLCQLIGPIATVRYHLVDVHPGQLCHVCCSQSPIFTSKKTLRSHLSLSHRNDDDSNVFQCFDCIKGDGSKASYKSGMDYRRHLLKEHLTRGDVLKPMRKKRVRQPDRERVEEEDYTPSKVTPVRNASGQDCFSISVLHMLAQTEMGRMTPHHVNCVEAGCILANFMEGYRSGRKRSSADAIGSVADNYAAFGIAELPVDCGEFLRGALKAVENGCDGVGNMSSLFHLWLEWKFECPECKRFMVTSMRDHVLRVDGSKAAGSLEHLLNVFLHTKRCSCGNVCQVLPGVRQSGQYIFVEIDRASSSGNDSKELMLYSLQLQSSYSIFGFRYRVLATVSYNLEEEEGGHYVTNLFPNATECVRIHEDQFKTVRRKPDFDSDTVLVALEKVEMTANDLGRIELEIEYENPPSVSQVAPTIYVSEAVVTADISPSATITTNVNDTAVTTITNTEAPVAVPSEANCQLLINIAADAGDLVL